MPDTGFPPADTADVVLDVRGLAPPEPLERVLDALATLPPTERLLMIIDREPRPLYGILRQNGFLHACTMRPDAVFEVLIWRGAAA
ncbi:DUF2249 domain-containing protein [Parapusillimonas granuli]|uniref:DUF2249 domain-containing protein n=1 Tax=Parapusillimonas granuli TaxID=380911 RepID=A0A853G709_9BURK|nr:DUF2249 domain-containing protein [Parapusillimonas granuli]MBB5214005.1 uncharacterized protein (DUF2249 family) [Parapusillimonas granuli]MEB2400856.1 DUF2249 domain-containing protein [Alcaligenaceae bacterium]NYT50426.1 DUF2249 domain-containing protein [Parapusillimonas granuli]